MRALMVILAVSVCGAQAPGRPEFEAATIKPTGIDPGQVGQLAMEGRIRFGAWVHGNTAEYTFMTLRQLVAEAYEALPFQIDCPAWFLQDRFDIAARMPAGAGAGDSRLMLRALLEERFRLKLHRESREEAVSALVVVREGPKLTASAARGQPDSPAAPAKKQAGAFGGMMGSAAVTFTIDDSAGTVRFDAKWVSMADLARFLMNIGAGGDRPVVDRTGLKGEYDIVLEVPLSMFGQRAAHEGPAPGRNARPAESASEPGAGTVMRSLRRHGLDLQKMKAPVERLIVDGADRKPTEN